MAATEAELVLIFPRGAGGAEQGPGLVLAERAHGTPGWGGPRGPGSLAEAVSFPALRLPDTRLLTRQVQGCSHGPGPSLTHRQLGSRFD